MTARPEIRPEILTADIAVAGGGIAGMTATAVFAALGLRTICIEPARPVTAPRAAGADLRSTAFLEPAIALMDEAGLWDRLAPHGTDLRVMRLLDAAGPDGAVREQADFDAAEIGRTRFGVNLPNRLLRRELLAHLEAQPFATLLAGTAVRRLTPRTAGAILHLSDGRQVRAPLVVAADGRDSPLRQAAGISAPRWDYGQQALVFAVAHPRPHDNVSIEVHRDGGPFTLVPLPDRDGTPHSAVVWMERGAEVARLRALDTDAFAQAATERSCGELGPLTLASERAAWPIVSQIAARFDAARLALIAEAAHVVPPIGAQGLNTSLADVACLKELIAATRGDIGAPDLLARYNRARQPETALRVAGIDALNRAAMTGAPTLQAARRAALALLHRTGPLKTAAMRLGLGAHPASTVPKISPPEASGNGHGR
ncbi:UbiH/UbiF family hydroxylase [Rhodobacteraceae bacterium 2CG4]|uniref:UbiH/UbiF family hydroxylase n=1 Tax=Halovulum marinum TaxID=2662447 RepID=A0A6L5YZX7_9RHOB|nr:FAD-dependent monooxygenase [Halovulum marinum]MSU89817.1 UbiH/UbiF family hydroxylase [Halovulum marinum]